MEWYKNQTRPAHNGRETMTSGQITLWFILSLAVVGFISVRYRRGLRSIPGPFLASISDLDRIWSCASGLQMNYHLQLHEKYGPLVRLGPKHVSFSDGSLIPEIYGFGSKFTKSDFYKMFDIKTPRGPAPTTFSVRDELQHRALKRPVGAAFSMSTMKELEPLNDVCSSIMTRKLEGLIGRDINLGDWVHWYAWDVISSITFSLRMGFLDQETDINNINRAISGRQVYNSIIGQAPYLDRFLFGNAFVSWIASFIPSIAILNSLDYIVAFTAQRIERYKNKETNVEAKDLLARFKRFKDGEQVMDDTELLQHASSNV